ncbi:hypothetical protein [Ancylobacter mangrovi]|uniref:hypothetical protein n=1 Tax=Ancylobacter mangrovi TaxID=2972472 RepID=UPI002161F3AF|nr:hypothetical protein [Ancylobacter mangrovi]MCS0504635.1 hypothetical protein [Ancylobacter mangrovi]
MFFMIGPTDIEDIVPYIRFPASDGRWMTGQTRLVGGGYTTKWEGGKVACAAAG